MRRIGTLPNREQADLVGDYLYVQKIENTIQHEEDGQWSLWVHDDDDLDAAAKILDRFSHDPENSEFKRAALQAKFQRARRIKEELSSRNKTIDVRTQWHLQRGSMGPVTLILIIISVGVAILSKLGADRAVLRPLFISDYRVVGQFVQWQGGLPQVMKGQVWRLITPIFIHFGLIHLLFNMLWLKDLGGIIEGRQGSLLFGIQVLVIGILSNFGQYLMSGPTFGGMSGVVYGLLGYIWIRGKFDPGSGLYLHKTIVIWMIAWFVICLTGLIGHVANAAHGVGLLTGMAWGYLSSSHWVKIFKR